MDEELKKVLKEEPFQEVGKIFISSVRCQKHYRQNWIPHAIYVTIFRELLRIKYRKGCILL